MREENKWNEFKESYENNLLILNEFFIFTHFLFPSTFPPYFLSFTFSLKFFWEPNIALRFASFLDQFPSLAQNYLSSHKQTLFILLQ